MLRVHFISKIHKTHRDNGNSNNNSNSKNLWLWQRDFRKENKIWNNFLNKNENKNCGQQLTQAPGLGRQQPTGKTKRPQKINQLWKRKRKKKQKHKLLSENNGKTVFNNKGEYIYTHTLWHSRDLKDSETEKEQIIKMNGKIKIFNNSINRQQIISKTLSRTNSQKQLKKGNKTYTRDHVIFIFVMNMKINNKSGTNVVCFFFIKLLKKQKLFKIK